MPAQARLIALERDGLLNPLPEDFIRSAKDWTPLPGALEAVARLTQAGWRVVVYVNEWDLVRGVVDMTTLNEVHGLMHKALAEAGARVEAVFLCSESAAWGQNGVEPAPDDWLEQLSMRTGVALSQIKVAGFCLPLLQAAAVLGCETHWVSAHNVNAQAGDVFPGLQAHADVMALADALLASDDKKES